MATAPSSTLSAIKTKVRRLTRSPSENQLTNTKLEEYINTFLVYDFPSELRLFSLRETLTFYTQPNISEYDTETAPVTDPLFNFKNKIEAIHPPVYIGGVQSFYTQERDVFYGYYPQTSPARDTQHRGAAAPITGPYTGTLPSAILQNTVMFSANDANGTAMILVDYPQSNTFGYLDIPGKDASDVTTAAFGEINYLTGVYTVTFTSNVATNAIVYSTTQTYQPGQPVSMLYYDNTFTIFPVPDKAYPVTIEVDVRPTYLMENSSIPELEGFWQYIAYGAAKKVFEDRMDTDSVQRIMPEFKDQETQLLRRTITQQANTRTVTIYTQGKWYGSNFFGTGWPY